MEGGGFIFHLNERGMTLAESMLALLAFLLAAVVLLPFCFTLIEKTAWRWELQEGVRTLYEEGESRLYGDPFFDYELEEHERVKGAIVWREMEGKVEACVEIREKFRCVVQQ